MRSLAGLLVAALTSLPAVAMAAADDGAVGRLDGDVTFAGGLGAGLESSGRAYGTVDLRLRYLDAAGIFTSFDEAEALRKGSEPGALTRAFSTGVELRPLFPVRFLKNRELQRPFADLVLDSLGLELGVVWAARKDSGAPRAGLVLGLAVEVPFFGRADGLWLRLSGGVRWTPARFEGADDPGGRTVLVGVGLAWHEVLGLHVVDAHDRVSP